MEIRRGIAVSPGVAIHRAVVVDAEDRPVPRRSITPDAVEGEIKRLEKALQASVDELSQLQKSSEERFGSEMARIFVFHAGLLRDQHLLEQLQSTIRNEHVTAEYAVYSVLRREVRKLQQVESQFFRERSRDFWDVERRILSQLIGPAAEGLGDMKTDSVLIAVDLTPSQTAGLDKTRVKGLATDAGGRTSHTAILAHALGIPAIVGLEDITSAVNPGDTVIIDGNRGLVIVHPDAAQLLEYRSELARQAETKITLAEVARQPAITTDGVEISLMANIEFPHEVKHAVEQGAEGIGLYRSEFIYLSSSVEPTEEEHYEAYISTVRQLDGRPLVIRTLDLGADKINANIDLSHERNPFLGCRSIRLCLQNLPLLKTQLRAILRASVEGQVSLMFPLICSVMEIRQAKMVLTDVMEDLQEEGIPFQQDIPVGMMVEVPAAALQVRTFCQEVDFLSIGTNDLIQYTVAVDRGNERIANLYSAAHPAVLQLVRDVTRAANRHRKGVSICGEMAGDPEFTMLLLGLGLRSLSMTPPALTAVKRIIRAVSVNQCQRVARKAATFDSDREVQNYLREELRRIVPDALDGRSIVG
ncbi:MAG: phosphoenolpyruvate--protein phosphotransferase [Phycisphaeraceae bacterium]|nr:phosphoenolpyruvate--protein phosphotransferase [Phycisphaeraceae bacterium]